MKTRPPHIRPAAALTAGLALIILTAFLGACASSAEKMPAPAAMPVEAPADPNALRNAPRQVALKTPFILPYGGEVSLNDGKVRLRFLQVLEDSRCPTKTFCVWTGQARWQGAAGHWMQRVASIFAISGSKRNVTSSQLWTRSSGACFSGSCDGILSRALRSISLGSGRWRTGRAVSSSVCAGSC